jgi:hypothetical protein
MTKQPAQNLQVGEIIQTWEGGDPMLIQEVTQRDGRTTVRVFRLVSERLFDVSFVDETLVETRGSKTPKP